MRATRAMALSVACSLSADCLVKAAGESKVRAARASGVSCTFAVFRVRLLLSWDCASPVCCKRAQSSRIKMNITGQIVHNIPVFWL
jgi:hypothetical protein